MDFRIDVNNLLNTTEKFPDLIKPYFPSKLHVYKMYKFQNIENKIIKHVSKISKILKTEIFLLTTFQYSVV